MRTVPFIVIILLLTSEIYAQNTESVFQREINFGTGVGLSLFSNLADLIELGSDGTVTDTRSSLAHTGYLTYRPRHFISFGLAGGTQYIEQTVQDFSFTIDDKDYFVESFKYRVNRFNIGFLLGVHYVNRPDLDVYTTIRAGWSIFSIQPDINDTQLANELERRALFSFSTPAFQSTLIGVRYYPFQYIGFHFEAGLGAPAYLSAGLSGRIPTGTVKPKTNSPKRLD
jgi:hypothetical protein